jgi:hypothetical protein
MQIVSVDLDHLNFFCPATGANILNPEDGCNEDTPSLMGYWLHEVIYEPFLKDTKLKEHFVSFIQKEEANDEDFMLGCNELESFLEEFHAPNWVVFCITTNDFACGPITTIIYLVIDMNTVGEGEGE